MINLHFGGFDLPARGKRNKGQRIKGAWCPPHIWRPAFVALYGVSIESASDDLIDEFKFGVIASAQAQIDTVVPNVEENEALFNCRINDKDNLTMTCGSNISMVSLDTQYFPSAIAKEAVEAGEEV